MQWSTYHTAGEILQTDTDLLCDYKPDPKLFIFLSEHYFNDSRGYLEVAEMSFGGVFARSF